MQAIAAQFKSQATTMSADKDTTSQRQSVALNQAVSLVDSTAPGGGYPVSWDSREHGLISPVRDQGQCGSCVAFCTCVERLSTRRC